MKDRCGATGLECIKCNTGGCSNRVEPKKPTVLTTEIIRKHSKR